jgi:hypothetical protein
MLTTPHAAAGIAIGAVIANPLVVAPIAVASHFLLDSVPHWQETLAPYIPTKKTYIRVPIDIALAVGITLLAVHWQPQHAAAIWTGAIFANLPDLDSIVVLLPRLKNGIIQKYWGWHCRIQRETSSFWGLLPQALVVAASLILAHQV